MERVTRPEMPSGGAVKLRILAISGSLRRGSLNSALLRAAQGLVPPGTEIELYSGLRDVPPYDGDLDAPRPPAAVADLRERIEAADGLLIATPEYNYGIPGVLKNALDWASRATPPSRVVPLAAKPVALMGASPTPFGTVRAQLALRQTLLWTDCRVVVKPEVLVFSAQTRFDANGNLTDESTRGLIRQLLEALRNTIQLHATPRIAAPAAERETRQPVLGRA